MIATRNRLIHAYLGIDDDTSWSIVEDDIPELLAALNRLKQELPWKIDHDEGLLEYATPLNRLKERFELAPSSA